MNAETNRKLEQLGRALQRLEEALQLPPTSSIVLDGTIQRFEFTFELFWKTLVKLLPTRGIEVATPRDALRQGFLAGWLEDEQIWVDMQRARNLSAHVYDEATARRIYEQVGSWIHEMRGTYARLCRAALPSD